MSFEIKEIKIKLYTNLKNKEQRLIDFDLDMLYHDTKSEPNEKGETKSIPLDKTGLNKLPFFTMSVKYPLARLQKDLKTYQERVKFFFDEKEFEKRLFLYTSGPKESEDVDVNNDIVEHNIMVMIELLFSTKFTVINNFHTSMDHVFSKSYFGRMLINPIIEKYYSYLKLADGKIYTFTRLIWLNDIMNNPLYRTFLKEFHTFWLWHSKEKLKLTNVMNKSIMDISKNVDDILVKLVQGIHQSFRFYDVTKEYDDVYLNIDDNAIDILSKLVRFKRFIDKLKSAKPVSVEDIIKKAKFDETNETKDKYFINQIKDLVDESIRQMQEEEKRDNLLINFDDDDDSEDVNKDSIYKKISKYIDTYFTKEEVEKKTKFQRFIKILSEEELQSLNIKKEYRSKHRAAIDELIKLNKLSAPNSEEVDQQIQNIKNKDSKLALTKQEELRLKKTVPNLPLPLPARPMLDKITSTLKTLYLNPLKVPLTKFDNLELYVTKPLDEVEKTNKTLSTEYATFMRNVRSRYWGAQRKSVNSYLQNLIDANDETNVTEFFNIFSTIYSMYFLGKKTRMFMELEEKLTNVVNSGITKINTNVQNWQYEVYIMADFIQGKVDDENSNKIFCPYVGEYLGSLFEFLFTLALYGKGEQDDKMRWAVDRNRVFFSLEQIKLKNGEMRQELTQSPLNVSLLAQKADTNKMSSMNPTMNAPQEEAMPIDEERINTLFVQNVISADPAITGAEGILSKLKQYVPDIDESQILSYVARNNIDIFKFIKRWHDNEYTRSQSLLEEMLKAKPTYQGDNAAIQQQLSDPNFILDSTEKIKLRTKAEFNKLYIAILDKLIELEKGKGIDTDITSLKAISGGTRRFLKKNNYKTRKYNLAKLYK